MDDVLATPAAPPATTGTPASRPRPRRRFWALLFLTLASCALFSPPGWHVLLRRVLVGQAARHGYTLTIGRMQGGPFDTIHVYDVRCRLPDAGTDVRIPHAEVTLDWSPPWQQAPGATAVQRLVLTGVSGRWDLDAPPAPARAPGGASRRVDEWLGRFANRFVPAELFLQGEDFTLRRNRCQVRLRGVRLGVDRHAEGSFLAREVEIAGPGFENTLLNRHGQTLWQGERLTLSGLDFGPGVRLVSATLDGTQIGRQRVDWDGTLAVMGGEIRCQGAINFLHPRLALEVGGSLRRIPVAPLARLLGVAGPAGGSIEQGSFSFRGDPEDWSSAQMWLAARATDFRWFRRDWESLELRATVLHGRVDVRRLELRQSRNRVSLTGDCPLLSPAEFAGRWWEVGFACNLDARLEDLHELAQLVGTRWPELDGRMSVNGRLEATPNRPGIDGYLNVEGSGLRVRGAPLDYLRSTLLFDGAVLNVADLQATRGSDYLAGRGQITLAGNFQYDGELHLAISTPAIYAPALAGIVEPPGVEAGPMRLDGVFFGPDAGGEPVFFAPQEPLRLPVPPAEFY